MPNISKMRAVLFIRVTTSHTVLLQGLLSVALQGCGGSITSGPLPDPYGFALHKRNLGQLSKE